jgi:uncharacterized protein involved in exopolysaccharide biosynthesis
LDAFQFRRRQFRIIARQQKSKGGIVFVFVAKEKETAILFSITEPNTRVVDAAKVQKNPVP